jgi:hypothetical protein
MLTYDDDETDGKVGGVEEPQMSLLPGGNGHVVAPRQDHANTYF